MTEQTSKTSCSNTLDLFFPYWALIWSNLVFRIGFSVSNCVYWQLGGSPGRSGGRKMRHVKNRVPNFGRRYVWAIDRMCVEQTWIQNSSSSDEVSALNKQNKTTQTNKPGIDLNSVLFCFFVLFFVLFLLVLVVLVVVLVLLGVVLEQVEAVAKPLLVPVLKKTPPGPPKPPPGPPKPPPGPPTIF